jgi:hypothetical protein
MGDKNTSTANLAVGIPRFGVNSVGLGNWLSNGLLGEPANDRGAIVSRKVVPSRVLAQSHGCLGVLKAAHTSDPSLLRFSGRTKVDVISVSKRRTARDRLGEGK